ncbi:MAG: carbohydrate kinase family protein [Myxococcota bacterium]|nr:carbohydrate kinase family protein [Myxococcota bacterium]
MSVLCTGSIAVDHIMVFHGRFKELILPDKIHALNVAFHVPQLRRTYGGCAANIAFNLKLLGEDPLLLGTVGRDFSEYAGWLDRHGIRRDWIVELDGEATAGAYITTDLEDNQIIGFHPGAMDRAHEAPVSKVKEPVSIGIVSPNGKEAMVQHAADLKARGVATVVDPGQGLPLLDGPELLQMIEGADTYIVNDYEWSLTEKTTGLDLAEVASRVGTLIVTRGEKGSELHHDGSSETIPTVPASEVVDPTGCGDAYRAGYLFGRTRGLAADVSCRIGSLMGSLMVEKPGTQSLAVDIDTVRERYQREFGASF